MAVSAPKQQRARQQLSCTACRAGKLRCDRHHPCDQCLKRSKETTCEYLAAPKKKKRPGPDTKDRISHLEGLVLQLMNRDTSTNSSSSCERSDESKASDGSQASGSNKPTPESEGSADSASQQLSYLKISNGGHSSYRGSSHWEAILASIADLREDFDGDEGEDEAVQDGEQEEVCSIRLNIVTGSPQRISRADLLATVPPRNVVDRLLFYWFNSTDPSLPLIHRPSFLTQYDSFWVDSRSVPTAWLSLLFSIMSLGARVAFSSASETQHVHLQTHLKPDRYQELAASALSLADHTKPQQYLIEALLLHVSCDYMKVSKQNAVWLLMSFVIRMALKMGYHRDPDNFPSISPFEGEMRRRVWNMVYIFDVLNSYEEGLPNMIRQIQSDTRVPRNLLDMDFGPDSKELPAGRPLTELSPISYGVVKKDLTAIFAQVCDISQNIEAPRYEEVLSLNSELEAVYTEIPPGLRFSTMKSAILDPPNLIFNRYKLELMFHKTKCCLHRRYMSQDVVGTKSELSRKLCVDAATSILKHHEEIFEAAQDGGPLSQSRYYVGFLNSADFLLGAMILCLELHLISRAPSEALAGPNFEKIGQMRGLLQTSYDIWKKPVNHFADTEKAARAMEFMLRKISLEYGTAMQDDTLATNTFAQSNTPLQTETDPLKLSGDMPENDMTFFDPLAGIFTPGQGSSEMDWTTFDKMIMDYPDPNRFDLSWPETFGSADMSSMADLGVPSTTMGFANAGVTTAPTWEVDGTSTQGDGLSKVDTRFFQFKVA